MTIDFIIVNLSINSYLTAFFIDDELRNRIDNSEDDSFTQWYNKELRVSKDEIPIVLNGKLLNGKIGNRA